MRLENRNAFGKIGDKERIHLFISFFFLLSDMLTAVSVIFSLFESDIKTFGFSDILIHL